MELCLEQGEPIGGDNVEVEIDETKIGKRKFHRGKRVEGQWVFGGCQKDDSDKMFLVPVPCRTKDVLLPLIQRWILPGSVISSDCWKPYMSISNLPENYTHRKVNHSIGFKAEDGTCTNTIEGSWRHLKRSLPHATRQNDYAGYLAEYLYRKKNRDYDLFEKFTDDLAYVFAPKPFDL